MTLDTPGVYTNLNEVYAEGFRLGRGRPFLGHRPILSKKPLQYANYHVWQSWTEVDARRRAVGSAMHKMFQSGELGGRELDTVGIWSKNCPSTCYSAPTFKAIANVTSRVRLAACRLGVARIRKGQRAAL